MSETGPSSPKEPIYGFTESFKSAPKSERIVSPMDMEYLRKLRVSAWSVRWVLSVRVDKEAKRVQVKTTAFATTMIRQGPTYVVYWRQTLELLRISKLAFDQLAIELPCLMGFRSEEVATWRAEYIDWVNGDAQVLDAKKHRLFTVPLNSQVAKHAMEILGNREEGYVAQSRSNRQQDLEKPLTPMAVWYIWNKWTWSIGTAVPVSVSPVVGRRFFAAEWHCSQGLSLVTLSRILGHSDPVVTMRYFQSLVFHEDVKRDYDRFQLGLMQAAPMGVTA